jgi:2-polyprenyl-6-hydroxyphenyl methylase/3-demethylubiquinone-9 3-methyltransferase
MKRTRQSNEELRDLYRSDYVRRYHQEDRGRLSRLLPFMDLGPDMVVADLGCGNGLLLELTHDRVGQYHGVDFSSEFIEEARRRQAQIGISNASFHIETITEFCDRHEGALDRVFALDFTEHVYDEDLIPIATSIRRSLREGGRLYIHTPNLTFFLELLKDKGICRQFPEHIAVRSADQYVSLLRGVGFREVKVSYLSHYLGALSWLHAFSSVPAVGKYLKARLFIECLA